MTDHTLAPQPEPLPPAVEQYTRAEVEAVRLLRQIIDMPIVPVSAEHAGAENGKTLIRAKQAARQAIGTLTAERDRLKEQLERAQWHVDDYRRQLREARQALKGENSG